MSRLVQFSAPLGRGPLGTQPLRVDPAIRAMDNARPLALQNGKPALDPAQSVRSIRGLVGGNALGHSAGEAGVSHEDQ